MKRQPHIGLTRQLARVRQVTRRLTHHAVELRHVRVRGIRRQVRAHAVHMDVVLAQVGKGLAQVPKRHTQVRVLLPATCVVTLQARLAHHLDRKAEPHRLGRPVQRLLLGKRYTWEQRLRKPSRQISLGQLLLVRNFLG